MAFTPQDIITEARYICNDFPDSGLFRQSNDELVLYVNSGLREMATFMPMMFSTIGDMTCEAGKVEQKITFLDAIRLLDVICIHDGPAITPFQRDVLDRFDPNWRTAAPGQAAQWSPKEGDPLTFYLDKPAPLGQVIDIQYVRNPRQYALGDIIGDVPESFKPALVDYVVYRSEVKDDENVLSARAAAFYTAFKTKIGVVENGPAT
ncbi:MAG TPA: DUF6682 family protein [Limnobacter sp.]|nr:DUF6682 family protein [Limnobacter sp.]